ncbi:MAG: hypothetical protein IJ341_02845 [Bacteroidales bacterium]|nr:hypothetical protein [Bacteroidales bacterium]
MGILIVSIVVLVLTIALIIFSIKFDWEFIRFFSTLFAFVSALTLLIIVIHYDTNQTTYNYLNGTRTVIEYEISTKNISSDTVKNTYYYNSTVKEHKEKAFNHWFGCFFSKDIAMLEYIPTEFIENNKSN